MKTFKEYGGDTVDPHYHAYGGSLLGPSLGQYRPVADLNANRHNNSKKQLLGPVKPRTGEKEVTKSDLDQLERYADRLFGAVGIDVEFTRHFLDRVNDVRNKMQITSAELTRLFKQSYKKFGKVIRKLGPDAQAVLSDMKTDINMPFVLNLKGGELELVAKTVMRKKDFKTSNPKLAFENVSENTDKVKLLKLYNKAMKMVAGSPKQKEVIKDIEALRKKMGLDKIKESRGFFTRGKSPEQKGKTLLRVMKSDLEKKLKGVPHSLSPDKTGTQIVIKVRPADVDKTKKLVGLPNITKVVSEVGLVGVDEGRVRKTIKVGEDALVGEGKPHYALVSHREVVATGTKQEMLELSDTQKGRVWLTKSNVGDIVESKTEYVKDIARAMRGKGHENLKRYADDFERNALKSRDPRKELNKIPNINPKQVANLLNMSEGIGEPNIFSQKNPRIPRKKGQPAKSKKHSDLYTDEDPRGTIHGLGFKDVETARASVKKIENSDRTHAHKIQAAIAMEQRARVMGKKAEAAIYRAYIEKMKKKTKEMRKEDAHGFKCPPGYKFDRKLMACVPKKTRFKTVYAYPYFFGGTKSGDQSGQAQSGQNGNGNGNGNGNAQGGNGNGNGGNGNGGNGSGGNGGGNGG